MELRNIILITIAGFTLSYARYGKLCYVYDVMQLHARIWKGVLFIFQYRNNSLARATIGRVWIRLKILYSNFLFIHHEAKVGIWFYIVKTAIEVEHFAPQYSQIRTPTIAHKIYPTLRIDVTAYLDQAELK